MIEVKNISKRYRNTVLDDISFTAENHIAFYYGWCQQGTVWKNILQQ